MVPTYFIVLVHLSVQYQLYGEQVVKACISQKTNYVDITGETYVSVNSRRERVFPVHCSL